MILTKKHSTLYWVEISIILQTTLINKAKVNWNYTKYKIGISLHRVLWYILFFKKKLCLPFYGGKFGEGLLGKLLNHIENNMCSWLKNSLQANKKSKHLVTPMHHADVSFVLKRWCQKLEDFSLSYWTKINSKYNCWWIE